jgi:hypothetical protein
MANLIEYDRETWLDNWQTKAWPVVQIRYVYLNSAEEWIRRDDVPGRYMAKVMPYHTQNGWYVALAISDPNVAFDCKLRFG